MTVLIGIPTYRRPHALRRLLTSLVTDIPAGAAHICVVDNDPEQSARFVMAEFSGALPLTYRTEDRRGVVHVRNTLVTEAAGHEALVFVDDDQWVGPGWFAALSEVSRKFPEAVVAGPVSYVLPDDAPERIRTGEFFVRRDHEDLETLRTTGTGNSLIPRRVLEVHGADPFDPAFASIGGEDTDFFLRVTRAGTEIRWAAKALVYEELPTGKATAAEALRRYYKAGYVLATIARNAQPRWRLLAGGCARIFVGSVKYVRRSATHRPLRGRDLAMLHGGRGYLAAARGKELRAYGEEAQ